MKNVYMGFMREALLICKDVKCIVDCILIIEIFIFRLVFDLY